MRRTALALLVTSSGCNWVFGLTPTVPVDGGADAPDAPPSIRTKLVWAITTTDSSGVPGPLIYKPIGSETTRPMTPEIMVGAPLGMMPPLAPAPYDVSDGSFEIPYTLRQAPHRIVYTLPGETVAHEVQWSVSGATLVVPRTTRFEAAVVPTNSGYTITPSGLAGSPGLPALFTTGAYTSNVDIGQFTLSGPSATFHYATDAASVTGPFGAPEAAKGDVVLLAERSVHQTYPPAQESINGFAIASLDLVNRTLSTPSPEPAWIANSSVERTLKTSACGTDCIPNLAVLGTEGRMSALGALRTTPYAERLQYGVSPSTELPGFLPGVAPAYEDRPLILPFLDSTTIDSVLFLRDPTKVAPFDSFDRVLVARIAAPRTVSGAQLTSSASVITKKFDTAPLGFDAPLALMVKLGTMTDLSTTDNVLFPASSQAVPLAWKPEDAIAAPDDYVVTLYEIANSQLAPVRIYHVLAPTVTVDGSLLQPQHKYVFAISARRGMKNASQGDFTVVTYPFSQTTTFAAAFTVQ